MYTKVTTIEQEKIFERLYTESFLEKNYETIENYKGKRMSYLVENEVGEYIGTIEFAKYNPSFDSILINPSLFLEHPLLHNVAPDDIWEVDKLTVKKSERRNGSLKIVVQSLYDIVDKNNVKFLIAEMNPIFCRALKIEFKLEFTRVSPIVKTNRYPYIPIIMPVNDEAKKAFIKNHIEKNEVFFA